MWGLNYPQGAALAVPHLPLALRWQVQKQVAPQVFARDPAGRKL